ncbi:MAG: hypothetical protein REH79_02695 [Spiroplasma sp.]|nr:hypothetical protein [Spiroplasma sp.]
MYRFKSIKYLSTTGLITGLLVVIGYTSYWFFSWVITGALGGTTTLQLFDAFFIPFCALFKGPMMLFAGPIAGAIFDLISGVKLIVIPATIIIRILMFFAIKLLTRQKWWWSSFYSFFFASLILMFGYPLYYLPVYQDKAIVINELITDTIQAGFAYLIALLIYYPLHNRQVKTLNSFWDDQQFDYLKQQKPKQTLVEKVTN